jgi:hypothetical protein
MNLRELLFLHAASGGGGSLVEYTATGNPVAFNTNVAKPLNSVTVPLTHAQSGTDDPSPTNIRPITGVSSLFCVHAKKNMAKLRGYSATNRTYDMAGQTSNNYGTSIDTLDPEDSVVITQSSSTTDYAKNSYRNGYVSIRVENYSVMEGAKYDISFKITDILSNPLDARLDDWLLISPTGSQSSPSQITEDVIIFKNYTYKDDNGVYRFEIRNCAMSCTLSEFMITPVGDNDGVFEPYNGAKLDIAFPALGKNLFNKDAAIRNDGHYYDADGSINASAVSGYLENYIAVTPDTNYVVNCNEQEANVRAIYFYTDEKVWIERTPGSMAGSSVQFCTPSNCYYIRFQYFIVTNFDQWQLELGTIPTAYEPYTDSVYGGILDVVSGVLHVTYGCHIFNGDETYQYSETRTSAGIERHIFNTSFLDNYAERNVTSLLRASTAVRTADGSSSNPLCFYNGNPSYQFGFYIDSSLCENTVESFKAWLAEHPCQVVFPLKEPFDVQLTPEQIAAFIGTNTIWTNTPENLTVMYLKKG